MNYPKNKVCLLAVASLLTLFTGCRKQKTIVVIYDNDVHCAVDGYSVFAGYRNAIEKADTAYVATVSSGDFLQGGTYGSISRGDYIIDLMNAVDYDVVTLGNHEFDYGKERMTDLLKRLDAEVVDANLTLPGTKQSLFKPSTLLQCGDKKVAFIGATTPGTMVSEAYSFFDREGSQLLDLHEADIIEMLQSAVDEARAAGADYVILLSHLGEVPVLSDINSIDAIAKMHGVDAVLDGHTHHLIEEQWIDDSEGKPVLLTQTGTAFSHIGQLTILPDGTMHAECHLREALENYRSAAVDTMKAHIDADLHDFIESEITHASFPLYANDEVEGRIIRNQETNLGDFVADALRTMTETQIGIVNGGGIRSDINEGPVKQITTTDVLPFNNMVVKLEMTGQEIVDLLEWTSQDLPAMSGSFLQVSGIRYTANLFVTNKLSVGANNRLSVIGKRRVKVEFQSPDGKWRPIDLNATYSVATIDYIANTIKAFPTMATVKQTPTESMTDAEVLLQYMHLMGAEIPEQYRQRNGDGRIKILKKR